MFVNRVILHLIIKLIQPLKHATIMTRKLSCLTFATLLITLLAGCNPEVGSKEWCTDLKEKPKADWSLNEATDYTRHCLLD